MGLDDLPDRGSTSIYDEDGETRVPKKVKDGEGWRKGDKIEWYSDPDEDFVRVYGPDEDPEGN